MKKFVEENTKLAAECENLLSERSKLEKECSLYDRDRDALMDFGNEADARAKEAETKVCKLVEELKERTAEVQYYKHQIEMLSVSEAIFFCVINLILYVHFSVRNLVFRS